MPELFPRMIRDPAGFMSVAEMPTKADLDEYYAKIYFTEHAQKSKNYQASYTEKEIMHKNLICRLYLHSLDQVMKVKGSILEIGSGEGFMLEAATKHGWDVKGVDYSNASTAKFNPAMLDRITPCDPAKYLDYTKQTYSVCMMHNVLEHVIDPRATLRAVKRILVKNGLLMITIPNDFSRLQQVAFESGRIEKQFWLAPLQHLHYFNTDNIIKFLGEMGYFILDAFCSFPIDWFLFHRGSNYISDLSKGKDAHWARIELDLLMAEYGIDKFHKYSQTLFNCGMGRDMTILARVK